ncbi:hypothetical protein LTR28_013571, partial [Elasticomyces elasticus]
MPIQDGLMRIFWPSDSPNLPNPGVLVGWRNSEFDVTVVAILHDVEVRSALAICLNNHSRRNQVRSVENALRFGTLLRGSAHPFHHITERCGRTPLQVLGTLNADTSTTTFNAAQLVVFVEPHAKVPRVFCPEDAAITLQLIVFDRPQPHRMQYMSMSPISLLLSDKQGKAPKSTTHLDGVDVQEEAERSRRMKLVEKLRLHTVTKHPRTQKELALTVILHQINCSYEVNILLQKNIGMVGVRLKRSLSVGERVVESATNLRNYVVLEIWQMFWIYVYPVASQLFILGLITLRMGSELALEVLEWRPVPDRAALKDISATAQQVDIRLQQFCYWPVQYLTLRRRRRDWESITTSQPEYIRFYNSLWLVANDVIIGIAIGSYIIENADFVARQVDIMVDSWSIQGLQRMISWLMGWPAGLKLNNELAAFLGDLFLWVIEYWA